MSMRVMTSVQKGLAVNSDKITNLGRWIFFSVLITAAPIIYNSFNLILNRRSVDPNTILAHGDLILVSVALLAGAIGDLVSDDKIKKPVKIIVGGSICFILVMSCLLFANVSLAVSQNIDKNFVTVYSFVSFSWTVILGAICKWLVEK